ncbi:MAG: hypothetical protein ABUL72_04165, partial [Armatimonadota bacterium]
TVKNHMMEGWACQVDGEFKPIEAGRWRTVETGTAGKHQIEFRYRPAGFGSGVAATAMGLAAMFMLTLVWVALERAKKQPAEPEAA